MNNSAKEVLSGTDRLTDSQLAGWCRRLSQMKRAVSSLQTEIDSMEKRLQAEVQARRDERIPDLALTPSVTEEVQ